uniref:Uncharacterized protein LOC113795956 n=1 Tax=Dermatophagoides pteronyssinus TaxID=6956 RepID=A0A6P6YBK8_DERPT|nr:uncharacterized protein LOC113795956 [Dermatophagoides pteronyssinus]
MNKLEYYRARKNIIEANNLYEKLVELSGKFPNELPIKNDQKSEMSALLRNCSKNLSLLLTETIYLVCELFIAISPYRYRTLIENDARENAIFHNNCIMFGHLMECFALTNRPNLDTLFELVPNIRNIGTKILMNQMRYHERIIYRHITNETFQQSLMEIVNETPRTDLRISSQSHFEFLH